MMMLLRVLLGFQTTRSASALPRLAVWRTIIQYKALSKLQRVETSTQPVANSSSPAWIWHWAFASIFPCAITGDFRGCGSGQVEKYLKMMDLKDGRVSCMLIRCLQSSVSLYWDYTNTFFTGRVSAPNIKPFPLQIQAILHQALQCFHKVHFRRTISLSKSV